MSRMNSPKHPVEKTQGKRGDLEVSILHSRCIGAAVCVFEAQKAFKLNKADKAVVGNLQAVSEKVIINSARNCPVQAIFVYKNKKQIWPEPGPAGQKKQPGPQTKLYFD